MGSIGRSLVESARLSRETGWAVLIFLGVDIPSIIIALNNKWTGAAMALIAAIPVAIIVGLFVAFHRMRLRVDQRRFRDMVFVLKEACDDLHAAHSHWIGAPAPKPSPLFPVVFDEARELFKQMGRDSLGYDLWLRADWDAAGTHPTARHNAVLTLKGRLDKLYDELIED